MLASAAINESQLDKSINKISKTIVREVTEKLKLSKKPDFWKKIDKKTEINYQEKIEKIKAEAETLDKMAKLRENNLKHKKIPFRPFTEAQEVKIEDIDDLLINSIQAKLKILK